MDIPSSRSLAGLPHRNPHRRQAQGWRPRAGLQCGQLRRVSDPENIAAIHQGLARRSIAKLADSRRFMMTMPPG